MSTKRKKLPLVFIFISALDIIYVVSLGNTYMLGDEIGGDPGGMLIPLTIGILMFLLSTYIWLTEANEIKNKKMEKSDKELFIITTITAVLYVVMQRVLGFILSTSICMYILFFAYQNNGLKKDKIGLFFSGMGIMEIELLIIYTLGRIVTRYLIIQSKMNNIPLWLSSSPFIIFINLIILIAILVLHTKIKNKIFNNINSDNNELFVSINKACVITITSITIFYLIFKQLFLVNVISGIIFW